MLSVLIVLKCTSKRQSAVLHCTYLRARRLAFESEVKRIEWLQQPLIPGRANVVI